MTSLLESCFFSAKQSPSLFWCSANAVTKPVTKPVIRIQSEFNRFQQSGYQ